MKISKSIRNSNTNDNNVRGFGVKRSESNNIVVIFAPGFEANEIYGSTAKYPQLKAFNVNHNMFVIGSPSHGRDYKLSSGGFVHGEF